jgi:sugar-specific transcriptional regulator TrmB
MIIKEKEIIKKLVNFGFTQSMAQLYLAGIKGGRLLLAQLARKAKIKRTTAYYIMGELIRRKFFRLNKINKRKYYISLSPEDLLKLAREKERIVKTLMPLLNSVKYMDEKTKRDKSN